MNAILVSAMSLPVSDVLFTLFTLFASFERKDADLYNIEELSTLAFIFWESSFEANDVFQASTNHYNTTLDFIISFI